MLDRPHPIFPIGACCSIGRKRMGKVEQHPSKTSKQDVSRRSFLRSGAAVGGAATLGALGAREANAQENIQWHRTADVVIVGAGVSGLAAAVEAREHGVSVIAIDMNSDIGGHGIMSGGQL